MVAFLLFLGIFTNLYCVTLQKKVNVALRAELEFNQDDIQDLDRVQKYLDEIKENILRRNARKHGMNKHFVPSTRATTVEVKSIEDKTVTSIPDLKEEYLEKRSSKIGHEQHQTVISDSQNEATKNIKVKGKKLKNNESTTSLVNLNTDKENGNLTNNDKMKNNNQTKYITEPDNKHNKTRDVLVSNKTTIIDETKKTTKTKNTNQGTVLGKSDDFHKNTVTKLHVTQNLKNNFVEERIKKIHMTKTKPTGTKHATLVGNKQKNKLLSTGTDRAKHKSLSTIKAFGQGKTKNKLQTKISILKNKETIKEKGTKSEEVENLANSINENYSDLDEYFKSRTKDANDGKNNEVVEKMKSDLGNLFSQQGDNSTTEKGDSFQELEKAFGFDM